MRVVRIGHAGRIGVEDPKNGKIIGIKEKDGAWIVRRLPYPSRSEAIRAAKDIMRQETR